MNFLVAIIAGLAAAAIFEAFVLGILRAIGVYAIVKEREARVYVLFGKVLGVVDEPGFHWLWPKLGMGAAIVNFFGQCYVRDLSIDQEYLRSTPVNSEEGAPMGIGMWFEYFVSDPVAHVFKNADPEGSLRANVSNATVRCLSNMPLTAMMENRHKMSQVVRDEVSPQSHEWGYKLGSVYIRKVHFRDAGMIRQIEAKVVNRLRQVTSAIKQDGLNQVNIIASTAESQAAAEFAKAAAMRPTIVGAALQQIGEDREVSAALFDVLETQRILDSNAEVTLVPQASPLLGQLLSATPSAGTVVKP